MGTTCAPNVFGLPDCGVSHPVQALIFVVTGWFLMFAIIYLLVRYLCKDGKEQAKPAKEGWKRK
jgi:hypothetical protein